MSPPPLTPFTDQWQWTDTLTRLAQHPLELCPDFADIAARHEAWWTRDNIDRPLFLGTANSDPKRPIQRRLELLEKPEQWLAARETDLHQVHRVGDSLPVLRVDFGPVLLAGLLGGEREIGSNTAWTHAFINEDWSNAPAWTIPDEHPLWIRMQTLARCAARAAAGRYLVSSLDLGNVADILLNLRGSSELCMDTVAQPEQILRASAAILSSWDRAFQTLYQEVLSQGAGLVHWLGLWSHRPYDVPACDFSALIGPETFAELFLPGITHQAKTAGRAVYHLDGPDAVRHLDRLLDVPQIRAIQFSPGAGSPSALARIDVFRKIQESGRSLLIYCPAQEVLSLCEQLRPEGLAIHIDEPMSRKALDELYLRFLQLHSLDVS